MIKESKVSKYMLYAIGEIVLVIVGILIALQVNNWNQKRIDTSSYNIILNSLVTDLENDVSELTNLITISKQQNKIISKIINTIKIPKDSLVTVFNILCFTPESFTPNTSSFNILNNHGSFDLLKIKEVSTEVQSLYNSAIKINQESYLDRNKLIAEIIRPFIIKSGYVSIDQKNNILINENELLKILYTNIELKGHLLELFMINNILISERLSPLNDKFKEVANNLKQRVKLND